MYVAEFVCVVLVALNIADVYTTYKILKNGGQELNESVRFLIRKLGLLKGLIASKIILLPLIIIELYFEPRWFDYGVMVLVCGWYAWVVYHNVREL